MPGWPGSPARSRPRRGERRHPDQYRARGRQERRSARENGIVQTVADSTPGEDSSSEDSSADPKITKLLSSPGGATPRSIIRTPRSRPDEEQRISDLLAAAVSGIGGSERSGQTL